MSSHARNMNIYATSQFQHTYIQIWHSPIQPTMQKHGGGDSTGCRDMDSARALGDAMMLCTAIPWALCALLYSGLHITYRSDRTAAQAYQRARSGFFSTTVLPSIEEERTEDEADREAALAAMGSRRMPLIGRSVVVLEGGRSRSA